MSFFCVHPWCDFLWYKFFRTVCGWLRSLDVLIDVPFINSTGLAIVPEADLRCGDFLSEKIYRHSAGSLSFFLVLTTRPSLSFHKIERQSCLIVMRMHFLLVNSTCECLVFDFSFILWNHVFLRAYQLFCCSRYKFFHLWSQCLADIIILLWSFLFSSTEVVVFLLANLRWSVHVWIKLSQIGSFHELLVLATECFFSFDIFEIHSDAFLGC